MSKNKSKGKHTPSSGKKKRRDCQRRIKILEKKIIRWDRYRNAGKEVSKNNSKMSRAKNWNVDGLYKQIEFLQRVA